jgi:hypothetical protein
MPAIYDELIRYMRQLERLEQEVQVDLVASSPPPSLPFPCSLSSDWRLQYIEFTVEDGVLYILEVCLPSLPPSLVALMLTVTTPAFL